MLHVAAGMGDEQKNEMDTLAVNGALWQRGLPDHAFGTES